MAVVTILSNNQTFTDEPSVRQCLKNFGIDYERWSREHPLPDDASPEEVLSAYSKEIDQIKAQGFDVVLVDKVLKMVNVNEYKRNQFCPIIRISSKAFGVGRRVPIVGKYLS